MYLEPFQVKNRCILVWSPETDRKQLVSTLIVIKPHIMEEPHQRIMCNYHLGFKDCSPRVVEHGVV